MNQRVLFPALSISIKTGFLWVLMVSCSVLSAQSTIYLHNFGTTTITTHPYTVAPGTFGPHLSNSSWANSTGAWTSFAGVGGLPSQAIALSNSSGTPTITLTFDVAAGYSLSVTQFNFWRQRSSTGAQNWSMTINGISVGSGSVPETGAAIGVTNVANPVHGLTGTVTVVLSLSGATGTGTFRLDNFQLIGLVLPPDPDASCTPPAMFDYDVVAVGTVDWTTLLPAVTPNNVTQKIRITGTGTVNVENSDLLLKSATAVLVVDGPTLQVRKGNFKLETAGSRAIFNNATLRVSGNTQLTGSIAVMPQTSLCMTDCIVEIGDEEADGFFSADMVSSSSDFQNDGGYRYLKNVCMNITHDLQLSSSGDGTASGGGLDVYINVVAEIGDRGPNHATPAAFGTFDGDDSGNLQNNNTMLIYNSAFILANGNVQNQSSSTMFASETSFKLNHGSFQNSGTLNGSDICLGADDQIQQNSGSWQAGSVSTWYAGGSISGAVPFPPPAESAPADIIACVAAVSCMPCVDPVCDITGPDAVCANSEDNLYSAPAGMATYAWSISGDGTIDGADNAQDVTVDAGATGSFTLTLVITDANGCSSTCMKMVTIGGSTMKLTAEGPPGATCGDMVSVTIKVTDFTDIGSLDFSVNWDDTELMYVSHSAPDIEGDAPVVGTPMSDQATFTWFDTDFPGYGASLPDGTVIFTLNFKVIAQMAMGVNVDITGTPTAIAASDKDFCDVTVTPMNMVNFDINKITVTCPSDFDVCLADAPFALTGGMPAGGTYSGMGVSMGNFNPAAAGAGAHTITYTYTDANGCTNSCTFDITVNANPVCNISGPDAVCAGTMGHGYSAPGGMTTYSWSISGNGTFAGGPPGNVQNVTVDAGAAGSYTVSVTITDANGCTSSCSKMVTVNANPVCNISGPDAVCAGTMGHAYSAPGGMTTYAWSITGNGAFAGGPPGNVQNVSIDAGAAGSYTVSVTITDANGCTSSCSKMVTVNANPVCNITGPDAVCAGTMGHGYSAPGGMTTYLWSISGNGSFAGGPPGNVQNVSVDAGAAGSYTVSVTITDANGCTSTCSKMVTVNANPVCNISGPDPVCAGTMGHAYSAPMGMTTYSWSISGNGSFAGGPPGNVQNVSIDAGAAGSYTVSVTITDANGCTSTCSKMVTVNANPVCNISGPDPVCAGTMGHAYSAPMGMTTYSWSITGNGSFAGGPPGNVQNVSVDAGAAGSYTVSLTITDANGCTSSCSKMVTVNANPACSITGPDPVCAGTMGHAYSAPMGMTTYSWSITGNGSFAGGPPGNVQNVSIDAGAAGSYTVSVTITDANGCTSTCSKMVTVNAFTPANCPSDFSVCLNDAPFALTGATPLGGTYSGTGVTANNFDPAAAGVGPHTITYTVVVNGCINICTFDITVNPNPPCTISGPTSVCPGSTNQHCGPAGANFSYSWSVSGSFGPISDFGQCLDVIAGAACGQSYMVTLTVTDNSTTPACSSTCTLTVNINDVVPPSITCPDNITVECEDEVPSCPANFAAFDALPGASASDNCDNNLAYMCTTGALTGGPCGGTISRTHKVTDNCGNTDDCVQTITVDDNTPPSITCPDNVTVECEDEVPSCPANFAAFDALPGASASDNCDDNLAYMCTTGALTGGPCGGTISRTHKVTDDCGNTNDCVQTITVDDNTNPVAKCRNITIELDEEEGTASISPSDIDNGSTDNCGIADRTVTPNTFDCQDLGQNTVVLKVTDICGNTATCQAYVTVLQGDFLKLTPLPNISTCPEEPVEAIELSGLPLDQVINYNWSGGAPAGLADGFATGADPEIPGFIAGNQEGSWTVTVTGNIFLCTDTEEFTITVNDFSAPHFINCPEEIVVNNDPDKCGANVNWQAPIAVDGCAGFNELNVYQVIPPGNTSGSFFPVGEHLIKYVADDQYGNKAKCEFKLRVRDMQLPDIECPSGIQYLETNNGNCSHTLTGTYLNASVVENCALEYVRNDYTDGSSLNGAVFPVGPWPVVVKWTAEDVHGNSATCTFAVIVVDNDAPTVASCPSDKTVDNDAGQCGAHAWYAAPRFNDNCGGAYQAGTLIQGGAPGDFFAVGATVVEWQYFDPAGNGPATCNFVVTVRDEERPEIDCPGNITIETDGSLYGGNGGEPEADPYISSRGPCGVTMGYAAPVGTDNCPGAVTALASGFGSGPNFYQYGGIYTEGYIVTDNAGNTAACSFTVRVKDPISPTITCPSNTTVTTDVGECDAAVSYAFPYFGDNCPDYSLTKNYGPNSGEEFPLGTTAASFTVEDAAGNETTCAFTVTVEDRERPFINNCPTPVAAYTSSNGTGDCSGAVPDMRGDLVASDNCGVESVSQSPAPGTAFGFVHGAMQTVTFTVTDDAGNTSSCESKVTLKDNEEPSINCNVTKAFTVTAGICGHLVTVDDNTDPAFSDNCQGAKRSHDYINAPHTHTLAGAILPVGSTTVAWTITDAAGNTKTCEVSYTVADDIHPVFVNCPSDVTLNNDVDKCGAKVFWVAPVATDDCGAVVDQIGGPAPGGFFGVGTEEVSYRAKDPSGNVTVCAWEVTIRDMQLPDIQCPGGLQYVGTNRGDCAHTVEGSALDATATDNCGVTLIKNDYNNDYTLNTAVFPKGATVVTWTAKDAANNSRTCTYTVVVADDDDPTVQECPANIVRSNDPNICGAQVDYDVLFKDNCDGNNRVGDLIEGLYPGAVFPVGTTTVVWRYVDHASNDFAECLFTVTVNDTQDPVIYCPTNIRVNVGGGISGGLGGSPLAEPRVVGSGPCGVTLQYAAPVGMDNCPNPLTILQSGLGSGPNYYEYGGIYTETYNVIDASGNVASCSFTIEVKDPIVPTITCPANTTVTTDVGECDAAVSYAHPYFGDNCPNYALTQLEGPESGEEFPLGGTYVAFEVTDDAGNAVICSFTVTVEDRERPFINNCPTPAYATTSSNGAGDCSGAVPEMRGDLVASDNCGVDHVTQIPAPGTSFGYLHGAMQAVTFVVTDAAGNTSSCESKVTLKDDEKPWVNCGVITKNYNVTAGFCGHKVLADEQSNPTFGDNCDGATRKHNFLMAPSDHTLAGAVLPVGSTTVVWTVTDKAGNTETCSVTYVVADNIPPVFENCPSDVTLNNDPGKCGAAVFWLDPVAEDDCGETVVQSGGLAPGSYFDINDSPHEIEYTAIDGSGNETTCAFTITIEDREAPDIECPLGLQVLGTNENCSHRVTGNYLDATVTDNCSGTITREHNYNGHYLDNTLYDAVFPLGITKVNWLAWDGAGNTALCTVTVVVVDDDDPMVQECPDDITVNNDPGVCGAEVEYEVYFKDNCDGDYLIDDAVLIDGLPSGATFPVGTTTVIWRYVDEASNDFAECLFKVTVKDTEKPVIVCPTDMTVNIEDFIVLGGYGGVPEAMPSIFSSGPCGVTLRYTAPVGTDNCPNPLTTLESGLGSGPNYYEYGGIYTEKYKVTDASGNTATCSFKIVVLDPVVPTITCPSNTTVDNDAGLCGAYVTYSFPYFGDNCPNYLLTKLAGPNSGEFFPVATTLVSFKVTDDQGNMTICTFTVTVRDVEKPVIVTCPADRFVPTSSNGTGDCSGLVPDLVPEVVATDNCAIATITQSPAAGTSFGSAHGDMIFVTITVTDIYGNFQTCKVKLTLTDDENPMIDCSQIPTALNNTTGYCYYFVTGFELNPTYSDNCGPLVLTNTLTGNNTLGGTPLPVGSTTVTWKVTDAAGNMATCSVTYVVTDVEPPLARCQGPQIDVVLDGNGAAQLTVADVNNDSWDNCGPLARTEIDRGNGYGQFVYYTCDDIYQQNGLLLVVLEVEDQHGNTDTCHTYVAVYDLESPVITCPNGVETTTDAGVCTAIVYGIGLQYAHDNCPVTITYEITGATVKSGTGDASGTVFNKGTSTVTYTVVDESGNSAVCSFDVEVEDDENPVIDCSNIANLVRSNNTDECSYTVAGTEFDPASYSDNCPGATITNNYNNSPSLAGAEFPVGLTIVIWTVTDASGNTVTCSSKVKIEDAQLPTIACPTASATQFANDDDQCSKTILTGILDPAFSDNCPDASITHNYVTAPNPWTLAGATFPVGSTVVVWTVKDKAGNTATCSITVTVTDTESPEFINCPVTMVMVGNDVDQCSAKVNWSIPVAEDNCDIMSIAQTGGPVNGTVIPVSAPFTVTYTATDIHGNTATCSFEVQVVDTQNPEFDADITMPNDITVQCDAIPDSCVWHGNGPQLICSPLTTDDVRDNCTPSNQLVITFTETSTQCANQAACCYYNYVITRTWKVTDAAGNMLVHTQVITVVDTTPPVAKCKNITVTLDKFGNATITGADINDGSTDNCAAPQYLTYTATPNTFGCNQLGPNNVTLTVTDPCGNSSTCTAVVTVVEGIGKCVPEYDLAKSVKCECLNNATTLDNGQFREVIQIWALAGQAWTLTANQGLYSPNSPAPPGAPILLATGTALAMGSDDDLDNDGDGTTDESDEMVYYTLKGIHVDGLGYTVTVKNAQGQALTISNKCYYPTPIFTNLDDPFCLSTPPFTITVGEQYGASGTVTSITVNGVATTTFNALQLGVGSHKVAATFDAGTATPFIKVNGQPVSGSEAAALADPGCQQMIMQFVQVVGTPPTVVCNDLLHVSLDADCEEEILADDVLEGTYFCYDDYKVELDKVPPYGNGPWVPAIVTADDIGKTYAYRVVHLIGGNVCWGNIKIEDKLPPAITCPADISILCTDDEDNLLLTGSPAWEDCSAVNVSRQDDYVQYTCAENSLVFTRVLRTWTATDIWGNASTCLQTIDKLRGKTDQVEFPADVEYVCDALPSSLEPGVTGWPTIGGVAITTNGSGACGLSVSYADEEAAVCPGSYKIIRTWKITDWCTGTTSPVSITHVQYIKVHDAPPTIDFANFAYDADHGWYVLSANTQYNGQCIASGPLPLAVIEGVCNNVAQVKITTPVGIVQNGGLIPAPGLSVGQHQIKYFVEDECGNITEQTITVSVVDDVPPSVACTEVTQVAIGAAGVSVINAATFDQGTYDNCCLDFFEVRRMSGKCDGTPDDFGPTVEFCCADIGDTVTVVFRAHDCHKNVNDCMVQVFVEDKIKPTCESPANVTVSCEAFDPSLWAYGTATSADNCCLDTIIKTASYTQFDTVCNKGTINRTFRAIDCAGNSSQCTQRIVVTYEQDYWIKFPNDAIVTKCDGTGSYGEPVFSGDQDCELLGVSYEDEVFTVVPDACYKIERTWTIINWCTYDPNKPCVYVPNPSPNATANAPQNLVGPIVSPTGTPAPWAPTSVPLAPGQPSHNFAQYWEGNPNASPVIPSIANNNCFRYKQIIKIIDGEDPIVSNCPASPVEYCDYTANDPLLWNQPYWWDNTTGSHDLCEGDAPLTITATDSCSGANLNITYLLFLDTDGDGVMETVVNSNNVPAPGTVNYDNLGTPSYLGGTPQVFDGRPVLPNDVYRWANHQSVSGTARTASVQWKTFAQLPTPASPLGTPGIAPQLPYGTHKIKWTVTDGCGNETHCEYQFTVKDCKAPTVVCHDGLSVNIMPGGMITLWAVDFLQYGEDNCTPSAKLRYAIRLAGSGTGFPVDALGNPITSITFDCAQLGEQEVELWAMDLAGNASFCQATIDVQDPDGNCDPNGKATIAGALKTEGGDGLEDAGVSLQAMPPAGAPLSLGDMSDDQGAFMFPNAVPLGSDYTVTPLKDDNPLNGVSTYDLVLISKHILGLEPLPSPYKMIAADANKSNSITTFDIVEIRKLILGIYSELPNNTSWRFVDEDYAFPNPANPFQAQFPEIITVSDVQSSQMGEDFVAVKVGDVNGTAIANSLLATDDRSAGTLLFDTDDRAVKAGETFTLTFKAAERAQGYQFTMSLSGLEVVSVTPGAGMSMDNFGVFADAVTTSVDGEAGEFAVTFRALKSGRVSEMLGVSSRITRAEAYSLANNRLDVAFRFNGATQVISGVGFELYQNQPNPFVNKTVIGFHLPEAAEATLTVFDESGRMLFVQKGQFAAGYNAIAVDRALLSATGVMYYKLETATDTATKKMIQTK